VDRDCDLARTSRAFHFFRKSSRKGAKTQSLSIMTRRRFHAPPNAFSVERQSVRLAAEEARHLRDVLRLQRGDEVYVFDGEGKEFQCRIEDSGRDFAELKLIAEVEPARPESPLDLTLALALLKGEKFDLVVQKATELGVARVLPVITERADVRLRDEGDAAKRVTRWQRIALEAAKQSGRARAPEIAPPILFKSLLERSTGGNAESFATSIYLMFVERDGETLSEAMKYQSARPQRIIALVGSEGGWTDEEIVLGRASGWRLVTLGGRTLRAETAAISITALLQHLFGDLL
jgi:16S rRNA (uracil1498-N3)-methyltransferase